MLSSWPSERSRSVAERAGTCVRRPAPAGDLLPQELRVAMVQDRLATRPGGEPFLPRDVGHEGRPGESGREHRRQDPLASHPLEKEGDPQKDRGCRGDALSADYAHRRAGGVARRDAAHQIPYGYPSGSRRRWACPGRRDGRWAHRVEGRSEGRRYGACQSSSGPGSLTSWRVKPHLAQWRGERAPSARSSRVTIWPTSKR